MPGIQDLLDGDLIIEDLKAIDKAGVIQEFAALLRAKGKVRDADALVREVLKRESSGTTGVGDGIAIPHARLKNIPDIIVAFGRSARGVDFQSIDGKPAYLFFLFATSEDRPDDHLRTLRRLSRIMRNPSLREQLKHALNAQELQRLIVDEDSKYLK